MRLAHVASRVPAGIDHGRAFRGPAEAGAGAMTGAGGSGEGGASGARGGGALPDPATFSSGVHGTVAGKRGSLRRLTDRGLDAWLRLSGTRHRIARLAAKSPRREVLVAAIYGPDSRWIGPTLDELRTSRHIV